MRWRRPETIERTSDPISAGKKPSILKPGVMLLASHRVRAFRTNENSPRVKILTGRVNQNKIGRIVALTSPTTTAAIAAAPILLIVNPAIKWAVISRETAVISQVSKKWGIEASLHKRFSEMIATK
jgi:hypothetical protein